MPLWSEKTEDQMIRLIQERPPLFDVTDKNYSSRNARAKLWREIENTLKISVKEVKRRWDTLRSMCAQYKRQATSEKTATARQQWVLTRLQFLDPCAIRQKSTSNPIMEPGASDLDEDSDDSDTCTSTSQEEPISPLEEPSFVEATDCNPLAESTISGEDSQTEASSTPRSWGKRSRKTLDAFANEDSTVLMRTLTKTLETIASNCTDDEIANFCKNVETRMRKLSVRRLPYIMNDLENCLFKHVLEDQNQAQSGMDWGTKIHQENSDRTGPPTAKICRFK